VGDHPTPYIEFMIGNARFSGRGTRGLKPPRATLYDGSTSAVRGTGRGHIEGDPYYGYFDGKFRDAVGNGVQTRVGDRVTSNIAADASCVVGNVEAILDPLTGHVEGVCPLGTQYAIVRPFAGFGLTTSKIGQASLDPEDGSFGIDWPPGRSMDGTFVAACQFDTGDIIQAWVTTT
jgi:hypothetical protein